MLATERPSACVAVLTFKRADRLERLLPLLIDQTRAVQDVADAIVLVVDNDPAGSAATTVGAFPPEVVRYVHEPQPGIAFARNRALTSAEDQDLLIFIDDDEIPAPDWLAHLLRTHRDYQGAAVVGNVLREYESDPDPWILAGRFFDRDPIATGMPVPAAGTGNLLLDLDVVRRLGVRFDPVFGLSGGSDTLFTREIVKGGGKLIWCADAPVFEQIPADRLTRKWVLTRAFRIGNGNSRTSLALADGAPARSAVRLKAVGAGLARLGGGGLRVAWGGVTGSMQARARGMRTTARGAGILTGAFGYHYDREYRRARRKALGTA